MKEKLLETFKDTFQDAKFDQNDFEKLELNSIPQWDSMGNLNFLMNIETNFGIRLSSDELSETKSIKAILKILNKI
jgi:acyl carrier protein